MKKFYISRKQNRFMYELEILKHFKKAPIFSLSDVAQIIKSKNYAKKFLKREVEKGVIKKIMRDVYTFHEDAFLVSTFVIRPSYISSISALSFHHSITQIPNAVFCFTPKTKKEINFIQRICYFPTRYFFGFELKTYRNFKIPIATIEKAVIDSIGIVPLSVIEEAFSEVNLNRLISYLKKIKKSSIIKRIGFLAERNGFEVYAELKAFINNRYIFLDPLKAKRGKKNKKWWLIENG